MEIPSHLLLKSNDSVYLLIKGGRCIKIKDNLMETKDKSLRNSSTFYLKTEQSRRKRK